MAGPQDAGVLAPIAEMNAVLAATPLPSPPPAYPCIFVLGLPRSGTTLCAQLLCWSLDVGFIDNVAARFWGAPRFGIAVSRSLLGGAKDGSFRSEHGRSTALAGPHEFSYFWHEWLGIQDEADLVSYGEPARPVDWPRLRDAVHSIQASFGKPTLFKTNFAGQFPRQFADTFPASLFVLVERDPTQVALSITRARVAVNGSVNAWWATTPPNFADLVDLPFDQQIAGQVAGLRAVYETQLAEVDSRLVVRLAYEEMCSNPPAAVKTVVDAVAEAHGAQIEVVNAPPPRVEVSVQTPRSEDEEAVVRALGVALAG